MAIYSYRAKTKDGKIVEGVVEAETIGIANEILSEHSFELLALEEKQKGLINLSQLLSRRIGDKDLVIFSRQLAVLISAKVPLVSALRNIVRQTGNKKLKLILAAIADSVEGGTSLSDSLGEYPKIFDTFFVNIIKSGERSGRLDEVLNYLADQIEKDYEFKSKVKGAMIYPIFIISGLFIIGIVMMVFVVPRLSEMLLQSGAELPLSTKILIGTSNFIRNYWWLIIVFIIAAIFLLRFWLKTKAGRLMIDKIKLGIPVLGNLFNYIYVVRMTRSLKTVLVGGVDLIDSLEIISEVVGNQVYKNLILQTRDAVADGESISIVFNASKTVPKLVAEMMATGEEAGEMAAILDKISAFYDREVTNILNNLMSLLEPIIMVILGLGVGIMVAAIILPMYNLSANL